MGIVVHVLPRWECAAEFNEGAITWLSRESEIWSHVLQFFCCCCRNCRFCRELIHLLSSIWLVFFFFYLTSQNAENKTIIFQNQLPVAFLKPQDQTPLLCKQAQTCEIAGVMQFCSTPMAALTLWMVLQQHKASDETLQKTRRLTYLPLTSISAQLAKCSGHLVQTALATPAVAPHAPLLSWFSVFLPHMRSGAKPSGAERMTLLPTSLWSFPPQARKKHVPAHGGTPYQAGQLYGGKHFIP